MRLLYLAAFGIAGCLAHPVPDPDLAALCARHGCDAGAPSLAELRADWYADADSGAEWKP